MSHGTSFAQRQATGCGDLEKLQVVFTDFKDIYSNEIPSDLPPTRNIQHFIDCMPNVTFPNLLHYKLNPN